MDFINSITHIKWLLAAISVTTKKFSTGSFRVAVHNRIFCTEQEVTSGRLLYNSNKKLQVRFRSELENY